MLLIHDAFQSARDATSCWVSTDRLYYSDSYLSEFSANVVEASADGLRLYLDRTAFYPSSGGQPNDLGQLNGSNIVDIVDEELGVAHVLSAPLRATSVHGTIDWPRRFDHMQQHTGQHLLSAVFERLFGYRTLSFHMGSDVSTIELAGKGLTDTQIDEVESQCNQYIRATIPVHITFEDSSAAADVRKPSARTGVLRIIEIEGIDRSACGGTHVRSTAEIGTIQIRRTEKIRGNVRVEFVCGIRAQRRAKQDYRIVSVLARQAAVPIDALIDHTASLRARLTESEKECQRLSLELARREGEALYDTTAPSPTDALRRIRLEVTAIDDSVRAKVQAFTSRPKTVALVIGHEPSACLIACSVDSGLNAGETLKGLLSPFGARGGGSATLAQGRLPDSSVATQLESALGYPDEGNRKSKSQPSSA
jgi:alanyl-tRNA synthetase